jgi:hypothetical protein
MQFDKLKRRVITLLGGAVVAWPLAARAQQAGKVPRVGMLWHAGNEEEAPYLGPFRQGLNDLGYVESKNIALKNANRQICLAGRFQRMRRCGKLRRKRAP